MMSKKTSNLSSYILVSTLPFICYFGVLSLLDAIPDLVDREKFASSCELSQIYGYDCEQHSVPTEDGYVLTLHRVNRKNRNEDSKRESVLLMHCLECDSSVFLTNTERDSLGFLLAEANIDVWLGNVRGTKYSRKHLQLNEQDPEFWNFSWQEMAQFDLPAFMNYVILNSGSDQIYYIGQSQGSLIGFARMSEDAMMQTQIKKAYMLTPFVTLQNIQSPVKSLIEFVFHTQANSKHGLFLPEIVRKMISHASASYCSVDVLNLCLGTYHQFSGVTSNPENMNRSRIPVFFPHALSGTSLKNIQHYSQMHVLKRASLFDYMDNKTNFIQYGSMHPPLIDVSKVEIPVALYAGENDWLVSQQDVQNLIDTLPNAVHFSNISDFSHLDFIWGSRARELIYDSIVEDIVGRTTKRKEIEENHKH